MMANETIHGNWALLMEKQDQLAHMAAEMSALRTQLAEAEARVEKARNKGLEEAAALMDGHSFGCSAMADQETNSEVAKRYQQDARVSEVFASQVRSLITNTLESKEG